MGGPPCGGPPAVFGEGSRNQGWCERGVLWRFGDGVFSYDVLCLGVLVRFPRGVDRLLTEGLPGCDRS
jgi:hypothetical protein